MKCKKCGFDVPAGATKCPKCGTAVQVHRKIYFLNAGFGARYSALIIDFFVFLPLVVLGVFNITKFRSEILSYFIIAAVMLYKPFMESFLGATLGKMACGIKVVSEHGKKLPIWAAYVRFTPLLLFLLVCGISYINVFKTYSPAESESVMAFVKTVVSPEAGIFGLMHIVFAVLLLVDSLFLIFNKNKQAIHDMMVPSLCVYKPGQSHIRSGGKLMAVLFSMLLFMGAGYLVHVTFEPVQKFKEFREQAKPEPKPQEPKPQPKPQPPPKPPQDTKKCKVEGVMYHVSNPSVMIDGKWYYLGRDICGGTIKEITTGGITMEFPDGRMRHFRVGTMINR